MTPTEIKQITLLNTFRSAGAVRQNRHGRGLFCLISPMGIREDQP